MPVGVVDVGMAWQQRSGHGVGACEDGVDACAGVPELEGTAGLVVAAGGGKYSAPV
jgi:hypothetical protein